MIAIALTGLRRVELTEVPTPSIQGDEDVLIRVGAVGICGSDLHYFEEGRIGDQVVSFPFVIGHECTGVVADVGCRVTRVQRGDMVAVDPAVSCHECDQCARGRLHTCRRLRFLGCPGQLPGGMVEYLVMPQASVVTAPPSLSPAQAAVCEPLSVAWHAVRLADLPPGATAVVLGCGPIGLSVVQAARRWPLEIAGATDLYAARRRAAHAFGAAWVGSPQQQDVVATLRARHPGGVDAVFECAGSQQTLDQGVELLQPGGKLVVVGIPRTDRVSLDPHALRRREIALLHVRRQNQCLQAALQSVASGAVDVDSLVSHRFRLEHAPSAFDTVLAQRERVLKALIVFDAALPE